MRCPSVLQGRNVAGLGVQLELALDRPDPGNSRDPADELLGFVGEDRAGEHDATVLGAHFDGARMRDRSAELRADPLDEDVVGNLLLRHPRFGFVYDAPQALAQVASTP